MQISVAVPVPPQLARFVADPVVPDQWFDPQCGDVIRWNRDTATFTWWVMQAQLWRQWIPAERGLYLWRRQDLLLHPGRPQGPVTFRWLHTIAWLVIGLVLAGAISAVGGSSTAVAIAMLACVTYGLAWSVFETRCPRAFTALTIGTAGYWGLRLLFHHHHERG